MRENKTKIKKKDNNLWNQKFLQSLYIRDLVNLTGEKSLYEYLRDKKRKSIVANSKGKV